MKKTIRIHEAPNGKERHANPFGDYDTIGATVTRHAKEGPPTFTFRYYVRNSYSRRYITRAQFCNVIENNWLGKNFVSESEISSPQKA